MENAQLYDDEEIFVSPPDDAYYEHHFCEENRLFWLKNLVRF